MPFPSVSSPPGNSSPSTLTSPVTTDPLTFSGALTFSKNVTLDSTGSSAGTPRWLALSDNAGLAWRVGSKDGAGNAYAGMQGGSGATFGMDLYAWRGIRMYGWGNTVAPTPSANARSEGVSIINSVASIKGLVVQGAASQSVNFFEVQDSAAASLLAVNSAGTLLAGSDTVPKTPLAAYVDKSGSRTFATNYQPSATRPTLVVVTFQVAGGDQALVYTGTANPATEIIAQVFNSNVLGTTFVSPITFVVPPGGYYKMTQNSGTPAINRIYEYTL